MDLKTVFLVALWTMVAIFVATAILTLAALPGWVKIRDDYLKALFASLLLEVVGCIVGFVALGIKTDPGNQQQIITHALLEEHSPKWRWEYVGTEWKTTFGFNETDSGETYLHGNTYIRGKRAFAWEPHSPVTIHEDGRIDFTARQTILSNIKEIAGPSAPDPGTHLVKFTLRPTLAFSGEWSTPDTNNPTSIHRGVIGCLTAGVRLKIAGRPRSQAPDKPVPSNTAKPPFVGPENR